MNGRRLLHCPRVNNTCHLHILEALDAVVFTVSSCCILTQPCTGIYADRIMGTFLNRTYAVDSVLPFRARRGICVSRTYRLAYILVLSVAAHQIFKQVLVILHNVQ